MNLWEAGVSEKVEPKGFSMVNIIINWDLNERESDGFGRGVGFEEGVTKHL